MDEEEHLWATVSGIDSDGLEILADLKRLQAGELDSGQASELLCDLTRDGMASTAGYAAIPRLLADNELASLNVRLEMVHAACLLLGLADQPNSPEVPPALKEHFSAQVKASAFRQLFILAAESQCRGGDLVYICAAALLLDGREDLSELLISKL